MPHGRNHRDVKRAEARKLFERAVAEHRHGRHAQAMRLYERVLAFDPQNVEALRNAALLKAQVGSRQEGVTYLERAVSIDPNDASSWNTLGNLLRELGRLEDAANAYHRALDVDPAHANALYNATVTLQDLGRAGDAIEIARRLVEIASNDAEAWHVLGSTAQRLARFDEAEQAFARAVQLAPRFADAYNSLGAVQRARGALDQAAGSFTRALELNPKLVEAHNNLGNLLLRSGKINLAIAAFRRALELAPNFAIAHANLGNALRDAGQLDEAVRSLRYAVALDPGFRGAHSNLVYCLNFVPGISPAELAEEHRAWGRAHGGPLSTRRSKYPNRPDPDRVLRVGYVSPDFRAHSVAWFFEPMLRSHNRRAVSVHCYANVTTPDEITDRLRELADGWHDIIGISDTDVAAAIESDGIDILVDLAGHTAGNRLALFALEPAPVQVSWIGYPNTTGLASIDYRFTDDRADPPGDADNWHAERLVRLDGGFLCYRPPSDTPPGATAAPREGGQVTFGSFNNLSKTTTPVIDAWCAILQAVPGSRLVLKSHQLRDAEICAAHVAHYTAREISAERITFLAPVKSLADHLASYCGVDIALDTFPYNGTTTTCEALWMGVPVVSIVGNRHAARVGASLLHQIDLTELLANDVDEYVQIAVGLGGDPDRLGRLRAGLRDRLQRSLLLDANRHCAEVEVAFRRMWHAWCSGQNPHRLDPKLIGD